jgi:hypothetical protein
MLPFLRQIRDAVKVVLDECFNVLKIGKNRRETLLLQRMS